MRKEDFEKSVSQMMAKLNLNREEAEDLVKFDLGQTDNEEAEQLTKKAKEVKRYESKGERKNTVREHKVDEEKASLLNKLIRGLSLPISKIQHEASFDFEYNNTQYTVKLIKHR